MDAIYRWTLPALWWSWVAYWVYSARGIRTAKRAQDPLQRFFYVVELVGAFSLITFDGVERVPWLGAHILQPSRVLFFIGAAIMAAGMAFSIWARVHLGEYWSGNITLKDGHRLIRTGPYRLVRHPIYTGLLMGMLGTAIAMNQVRGVIAFGILLESLIRKLRKEEQWLTEEFGEEYIRYKVETRALL